MFKLGKWYWYSWQMMVLYVLHSWTLRSDALTFHLNGFMCFNVLGSSSYKGQAHFLPIYPVEPKSRVPEMAEQEMDLS